MSIPELLCAISPSGPLWGATQHCIAGPLLEQFQVLGDSQWHHDQTGPLDQARDAIGVKHYPYSTETAYVYWAERLVLHHSKRLLLEMGEKEISGFLTYLVVHELWRLRRKARQSLGWDFAPQPPSWSRARGVPPAAETRVASSRQQTEPVPSEITHLGTGLHISGSDRRRTRILRLTKRDGGIPRIVLSNTNAQPETSEQLIRDSDS